MTDLKNLELTLDDSEIFNDLRVMVPRYGYNILTPGAYNQLPGGYTYAWVWGGDSIDLQYFDLVYRSLQSDSAAMYGRRTKVYKYHAMDASFAEGWAEACKQKFAGPRSKAKAVVIGADDERIVKCLSAKISDLENLTLAEAELDGDFYVDRIILDIRPSHISMGLEMREADPLQNLALFIVDTDVLDGAKVLG